MHFVNFFSIFKALAFTFWLWLHLLTSYSFSFHNSVNFFIWCKDGWMFKDFSNFLENVTHYPFLTLPLMVCVLVYFPLCSIGLYVASRLTTMCLPMCLKIRYLFLFEMSLIMFTWLYKFHIKIISFYSPSQRKAN